MKIKKFILLLILVLLLIPTNINAASVKKISISGDSTIKTGQTITQTFNIDIYGASKNVKGLGIGAIIFNIELDKNVFTMTGKSKVDSFSTDVYDEDDYYIITNTIDETDTLNRCLDGVLYCGNFSISLEFYVNDTNIDSSVIKMSDVNIVFFEVGAEEYSESDAIIVSSDEVSSKTITINKGESSQNEAPSSISVGSKEDNNTYSNITNNSSSNTNNDNNIDTYLSSLEIKGYNIEFDKNKSDYKVFIDKGVNKLEINAKAEKEDSKIDIYGADDLKESDYEVVIIVTSNSGYKRIYNIKALENTSDEVDKSDDKSIINSALNWIKKHKNYLYIGAGILLFVIIVIIIILKIKNKKEDKMFKNFDKF